ncbi:MAG: tetratricopeptide repeat protein, partial [Phycisphaerae bacterium]|jgi:tetratricopeptide (TPR) repeat protein
MGSKAVMVTAPVVVLLFDRVFLSGSFKETFRRRWALYVGLAATWSVLWICRVAPSVLDPGHRFSYVGFGYKGVTPLEYLQTQAGVLLYYLRLSFWPEPLCLDYYWPATRALTDALPQGVAILVLFAASLLSLWRKSPLGFLGLWFFLVLAPTSSFVPIKDPIFEHRMYLPLVGVVALVVFLAHYAWRYPAGRLSLKTWTANGVVAAVVICVVCGLSYATYERNSVYQSEVGMWRDVRAKQPESPRAAENLGTALLAEDVEEAERILEQAVEMNPRSARAFNSLGFARVALLQLDSAIEAFRAAVRLDPRFTRARKNLGKALKDKRDFEGAAEQFAEVLRMDPRDHDARLEFANTFLAQHRFAEAIEQYVYIVTEDPRNDSAWTNLGTAHLNRAQMNAAQSGGKIDTQAVEEAASAFRAALKLNPDAANAQNSLGIIDAMRGDYDQAIVAFREALRINPDLSSAHYNLANCLVEKGDAEGAARQYVAALKIRPNDYNAHYELGMLLAGQGQAAQAITAFRRALDIKPDHAPARRALDAALAKERDASLD